MTATLSTAIAVLFVLIAGWFIAKFFFKVLKWFIMLVVAGVIAAMLWYQPWTWVQ